MTANIKLSLIIPVYNIAQYLPRCLDSIINQNYKNLEIIVVNDGSTDTSREVIDDYCNKDSRIIAIHKENGGVSTARLAGISAATGDYIGFVDGDDYVEPDMFDRLVKNAVEHNADISHCGYKMVFPNGRIDYYYNTGRKGVQDNLEGLGDLLKGERIEPGLVNKIYKKSIVTDMLCAGEMNISVKTNEDLLMNYYLFKRADASFFEDFCPYHYILRNASAATSKVNRNKILDPVIVRKTIKDDTDSESTLYPIITNSYLRALIYASTYKKLWKNSALNPRKLLKEEIKQNRSTNGVSKKVMCMAWTATYVPVLYRIIRKTYDFVTGNNKKYSLE